jgi:hypothetical protein
MRPEVGFLNRGDSVRKRVVAIAAVTNDKPSDTSWMVDASAMEPIFRLNEFGVKALANGEGTGYKGLAL